MSLQLTGLQNNGETSLTNTIVTTGCLIDTIGGVRQVGFTASASAQLATSVGVATIASSAASIGLLCSGPISMAFASICTIPDARSHVIAARKELKDAREVAPLEIIEMGVVPVLSREGDPRVKSAKQVLTIKKIGVVSQVCLFAMGAAQTAYGVVDMLGSSVASVFHYSPVLTGAAAATATLVASIGLGVIYMLRGCTMITRAFKAISLISSFNENFKRLAPDDKIVFLQEQEAHGAAYMSARLDPSCLETTKDGKKCVMTARGFRMDNREIIEYTETEKAKYLQAVEKGIFTEKLKHVLCGLIGVAMVFGGILTLTLTALSHGTAPIVISLVSAIFFMASESIFLSYDHPRIFNKLRDLLFAPSIQIPEDSVQEFTGWEVDDSVNNEPDCFHLTI